MSETSRDVFVNNKLDSKIIDRDRPDGSHQTIVEKIHNRDFLGNDSASITQTITTDKNGNVDIKTR